MQHPLLCTVMVNVVTESAEKGVLCEMFDNDLVLIIQTISGHNDTSFRCALFLLSSI